jgi:hypothetical protein
VLFFPLFALTGGYLVIQLLRTLRANLPSGVAELVAVLTWLVLKAESPLSVFAPLRMAGLLALQALEPAALAIPAMLGEVAAIALAWTSRSLQPHRLDHISSPVALVTIVVSVFVTTATLDSWAAGPLGIVIVVTFAWHWHANQRAGGVTEQSLAAAANWAECGALAFTAWLF